MMMLSFHISLQWDLLQRVFCVSLRVMAVPATVVYFTVYDRLKYKMGYLESDMSTLHIPMLAGCVARGK